MDTEMCLLTILLFSSDGEGQSLVIDIDILTKTIIGEGVVRNESECV